MKNMFNILVVFLSLLVSFLVWWFVMGHPDRFSDGVLRHEPKDMWATIHTGGFLVAVLMSFILIAITFVIERYLTINKAQGKRNPEVFLKDIIASLAAGNMDEALAKCDQQRGSMANVLRSAILRFQEVENHPTFNESQKMAEVQRAIDEAMNLETPLLEKNLVILSTVASISTMVGLLGTTLGMIRSFQALGASGTVSATQLSIGISEALYNTAGGLIGAVLCIMFYNIFTTKVDNFVYMIDEAILSVTQIFTTRVKK